VKFPVLEGGDDDFCALGVGVVDGFGVVTERLLRETFGIAAFQGALGPGITVGMKGHTFDAQAGFRL